MIKKNLLVLFVLIFVFSCNKNSNVVKLDENYLNTIKQERESKDEQMRDDLNSPFNRDSTVTFHPLKYYEPTAEFIFKSKLYLNDKQDTITIFGTRGEPRKTVVFGYVLLNYKGKDYKLNVYKSQSSSGEVYYSMWFTDKTTGDETYPVGRYLDFELNPDPDYVYTIDFNKAYNPYCAYSSLYTCAIPTKDDYLDFAIKAGEKKFH